MLIQAIDFLHLYRTLGCKLQFGGSDQWGNITTGLELIRKLEGDQASAVGLSSPLLLKADGTKFGKSESGALWLDAELTSPYEIYQYFLNASDADVENYLKTLTLLSRSEIEALITSSRLNPELREAQKRLSAEIVTLIHGQQAFNEALKVTDALFSGDVMGLSKHGLSMLEKTLDVIHVKGEYSLIDALVETGLSTSKREARTFIQSGAIIVNETKISDLDFPLRQENALFQTYQIIRRGKKKYAMVVYL